MCQALYVTMHLCRSHSSLFIHHERNTWSSQHTQPCSTHHNISRRQIFTRCQSSFSMPTLIIATWWTSPTSTRIVFILTVLRCPCRRRSIEFKHFVHVLFTQVTICIRTMHYTFTNPVVSSYAFSLYFGSLLPVSIYHYLSLLPVSIYHYIF